MRISIVFRSAAAVTALIASLATSAAAGAATPARPDRAAEPAAFSASYAETITSMVRYHTGPAGQDIVGTVRVYTTVLTTAQGARAGTVSGGCDILYLRRSDGHPMTFCTEWVVLDDGTIATSGLLDGALVEVHADLSLRAEGLSGRFRGLDGTRGMRLVQDPIQWAAKITLDR